MKRHARVGRRVTATVTWTKVMATAMTCLVVPPVVQAADAPGKVQIFTCVDAHGQKRTSDRPIAECLDREQRVLGADGAPRRTLAPRLSPAEKAELDEQHRRQQVHQEALREQARRDRNLLGRYPDEARHQRARQLALDDVRQAIAACERRTVALKEARKPLLLDAEFYQGKPKPHKLKSALDANDTAIQAQVELMGNNKAELQRLTTLFDAELAHLRKLWAGAPPGSLGLEGAETGLSPASSSAAH